MRYYIIYCLFCTVMYTSRGSSEIPSVPDVPKIIKNPLNPSPVSPIPPEHHHNRFLLQYQPSEYLYPWNTYQNPRRIPMIPQRRQINNENYFSRRNNGFSPYYNPRIQNQGYHHPSLRKRWNFFHHETEIPINSSSSTAPSTPTTSAELQKNITSSSSTGEYSNSSTNAPPLTPSNDDYNALNIQNRDAPVWQVPDESSPQEPLYHNYGIGSVDSPDYQEQNINLDENENIKNLENSNPMDPSSKFKRGFRLLPVSNNLYVLKQDPGYSEAENVNDNQKTGELKRSNPQFEDGTADLLSFKAHIHHSVDDIGKTFLKRTIKKDVMSSGAGSIGDNVDTLNSGLDGAWDPLDSALGQPPDDLSSGLQGSLDPVQAHQLQYQDPLLNPLDSYPQNLRMYDSGNFYNPMDSSGSYSGSNPGFDPYQPHSILTKSLYQPNPNLQSNFYLPPAQTNQWNPNYLNSVGLNSLEGVSQQNLAGEYNSVIGDNLDDLERGPRGDSEVPEDSHLGYLDKYARAVNSINDNWNLAQEIGDGGDSSSADTVSETPAPVNGQVETSEAPKLPEGPVNSTSLAMVIEPLTAQLQKLLSSIQQVNEKLMNDQNTQENSSQMDTLRRKRGVNKDSVPEDEAYDDLDDDLDDEEETREERSNDDDQDEDTISCPPGSSRNGKRCYAQRQAHVEPSESDKKIDFEAEDSPNNSRNTSHPQEIRKNQKESNNSIVSFFQKTFGMEKTTPVPSRTTWNSMSMSLATDPEETTIAPGYREHFVNPGFMNDVGEAAGKTTVLVSDENTKSPITSKIPLYPEEEQTRVPEMQEMIKTTPGFTNPPTTTAQQSEMKQDNLQKTSTPQTNLGTPETPKKMVGVSNYETLKAVESVAGARGQINPTISPMDDLETIRVAIEPQPDSSYENKIPNQLIRTNSKDLLMRLLPPEIIQNITDNGIIVRVPGDTNLQKSSFPGPSTSSASDNIQENSLWLFEGQGHIKTPQESRKAVESRSDGDGSVKSRGSDALVAVGDDDEEEGDTKLTIRLRLPNRGHSAHTVQKVQRSVNDKSNHKPEEFPQKTLTKRSEPVDKLDEEYDEDYQNIEKRNIEKIGNEYLDDLEENDGEFEDYDDEEPEEDLKNNQKRSDESSGVSPSSSASVPKIVLRLRFPETNEAPSDVLKRSSTLRHDKKRQQYDYKMIKKAPKQNVRIGRSLMWVMDEPEEPEDRFAREIDLLDSPGAFNPDNAEQVIKTTEGVGTAVGEATAYENMVGMLGFTWTTGAPQASPEVITSASSDGISTTGGSVELASSILSTSERSSESSSSTSVELLDVSEKNIGELETTATITMSSSSFIDRTGILENNEEMNSESSTTFSTSELPTIPGISTGTTPEPVIEESTESISTQTTSEKIISTEKKSQPPSVMTSTSVESLQTFVTSVSTSGISEQLPSTSEASMEISEENSLTETSTAVSSSTEMLETSGEFSEKIISTSEILDTSTTEEVMSETTKFITLSSSFEQITSSLTPPTTEKLETEGNILITSEVPKNGITEVGERITEGEEKFESTSYPSTSGSTPEAITELYSLSTLDKTLAEYDVSSHASSSETTWPEWKIEGSTEITSTPSAPETTVLSTILESVSNFFSTLTTSTIEPTSTSPSSTTSTEVVTPEKMIETSSLASTLTEKSETSVASTSIPAKFQSTSEVTESSSTSIQTTTEGVTLAISSTTITTSALTSTESFLGSSTLETQETSKLQSSTEENIESTLSAIESTSEVTEETSGSPSSSSTTETDTSSVEEETPTETTKVTEETSTLISSEKTSEENIESSTSTSTVESKTSKKVSQKTTTPVGTSEVTSESMKGDVTEEEETSEVLSSITIELQTTTVRDEMSTEKKKVTPVEPNTESSMSLASTSSGSNDETSENTSTQTSEAEVTDTEKPQKTSVESTFLSTASSSPTSEVTLKSTKGTTSSEVEEEEESSESLSSILQSLSSTVQLETSTSDEETQTESEKTSEVTEETTKNVSAQTSEEINSSTETSESTSISPTIATKIPTSVKSTTSSFSTPKVSLKSTEITTSSEVESEETSKVFSSTTVQVETSTSEESTVIEMETTAEIIVKTTEALTTQTSEEMTPSTKASESSSSFSSTETTIPSTEEVEDTSESTTPTSRTSEVVSESTEGETSLEPEETSESSSVTTEISITSGISSTHKPTSKVAEETTEFTSTQSTSEEMTTNEESSELPSAETSESSSPSGSEQTSELSSPPSTLETTTSTPELEVQTETKIVTIPTPTSPTLRTEETSKIPSTSEVSTEMEISSTEIITLTTKEITTPAHTSITPTSTEVEEESSTIESSTAEISTITNIVTRPPEKTTTSESTKTTETLEATEQIFESTTKTSESSQETSESLEMTSESTPSSSSPVEGISSAASTTPFRTTATSELPTSTELEGKTSESPIESTPAPPEIPETEESTLSTPEKPRTVIEFTRTTIPESTFESITEFPTTLGKTTPKKVTHIPSAIPEITLMSIITPYPTESTAEPSSTEIFETTKEEITTERVAGEFLSTTREYSSISEELSSTLRETSAMSEEFSSSVELATTPEEFSTSKMSSTTRGIEKTSVRIPESSSASIVTEETSTLSTSLTPEKISTQFFVTSEKIEMNPEQTSGFTGTVTASEELTTEFSSTGTSSGISTFKISTAIAEDLDYYETSTVGKAKETPETILHSSTFQSTFTTAESTTEFFSISIPTSETIPSSESIETTVEVPEISTLTSTTLISSPVTESSTEELTTLSLSPSSTLQSTSESTLPTSETTETFFSSSTSGSTITETREYISTTVEAPEISTLTSMIPTVPSTMEFTTEEIPTSSTPMQTTEFIEITLGLTETKGQLSEASTLTSTISTGSTTPETTSFVSTEWSSSSVSPMLTNPSSETLINTKFIPTFESISSTITTSIITEEKFQTKTSPTPETPTSPPINDSTQEPETPENEGLDEGLEEYETETETEPPVEDNEYEYEDETGTETEGLTDFFEYSEEGITQPWTTSEAAEIFQSFETATQPSENPNQSTLKVLETSSTPEIPSASFQTSKSTSEISQSSEMVLELSGVTSTPTEGSPVSSKALETTSELFSTFPSTSEVFQSSETTLEALTTLKSTSEIPLTTLESTSEIPHTTLASTSEISFTSSESTSEIPLTTSASTSEISFTSSKSTSEISETPVPELSTSPFPWETPGQTEQLTSIITEYESSTFEITSVQVGGKTKRTTEAFTLGDTEAFHISREFLPDFVKGSTTPKFGAKAINGEPTTEFVVDNTLPHILERPEEGSNDYHEGISSPEPKTPIPLINPIETTASSVGEIFSTDFQSFSQESSTNRLDTSPKLSLETEIIISSIFPTESLPTESTFSPEIPEIPAGEKISSEFNEENQFIASSTFLPLEESTVEKFEFQTTSGESILSSHQSPETPMFFISSVETSPSGIQTPSPGLFQTLMTTSKASESASEITGESSPHSDKGITENPETLLEDEEKVKDEQEEQLDRRQKLEKRIKELEDQEKALLDREAELRRLQEEWEREKARRQRERERLEEERRKKLTTTIRPTTTTIPTTTIDYAKLQELEDMKRKQEELNDELERMEKEIADKERQLEEREKALNEEEEKYKMEKEEFERLWNEQKEEDIEEREKELDEKEERLKEEEKKLGEKNDNENVGDKTESTEALSTSEESSTVDQVSSTEAESSSTEAETSSTFNEFSSTHGQSSSTEEYSSSTYEESSTAEIISSTAKFEEEMSTISQRISTGIPPTESTLITQSTSETSTSSTPQLRETTPTRGEGDEEPDESSGDYIFDENEDIWKSQPPPDYDRDTNEGSDEECEDEPNFTLAMRIIENDGGEESEKEPALEESKQAEVAPESATKRICLHVLDTEDSSVTVDSDEYVTEVMCMPNYHQLQHQQRKRSSNRNSRRRRLMNSEETSTVSMDLNRVDVDKRSKEVLQDLKIKPIASLDLMHGEWVNNDTTIPLHTPVGFTRVYESWSKVPFEPFTFMEDFTRKGVPVQDETFMRKNFKVNKFDQRIQPTQVNRLANDEWTEAPGEATVRGTTGPDQDEDHNDETADNVQSEMSDNGEKRKRKREWRGEDDDDDSGRPTEYPPEYEENCLLRQHGPWKSERPDTDASENEDEDRNDEDQVFVEPEEKNEGDERDEDTVDVGIEDDEERTIPPPSDDEDSGNVTEEEQSENHDQSPSDDSQNENEPQNHDSVSGSSDEDDSKSPIDEDQSENNDESSSDDSQNENEPQNHDSVSGSSDEDNSKSPINEDQSGKNDESPSDVGQNENEPQNHDSGSGSSEGDDSKSSINEDQSGKNDESPSDVGQNENEPQNHDSGSGSSEGDDSKSSINEDQSGNNDGNSSDASQNENKPHNHDRVSGPSDENNSKSPINEDKSENNDKSTSDDGKEENEPQNHDQSSSNHGQDEDESQNRDKVASSDDQDKEEPKGHDESPSNDQNRENKPQPKEDKSKNDKPEPEKPPTTRKPIPSSSKASQQPKTTQSLPKTTNGDYGDIEYFTDDSISIDDYEGYDEEIPEGDWQDYGETSDEKSGESRKREGKLLTSLQALMDTKEILKNKQESLLRREDLLIEKEKVLKQEEAQLEHLKEKRSKRKAKKNNKQVTSWPTEGTGRYHLGGYDKWDSGLLEDVHKDYKKNKQAFTVNVLRLDYDENEENHKLKCEEPDKDDLVVNQGLVTWKIEDTTMKITPVNLETTTKEFKLYYDPKVEANVVDDEKPSDVFVDKNFGKSGGSRRTTKSWNPPGTEWPTEKTTKYHVGGTRSWDKELTGTPDGGSYKRRNVRGMGYYDDQDDEGESDYDGGDAGLNDGLPDFDEGESDDNIEEQSEDVTDEVDAIGTTCYTLLLKKEHNNVFTNKRSVEDQIPRPEGIGDVGDENLKPLKPKLRTIKSITRLSAEESPRDSKNNDKNRRLKIRNDVTSSNANPSISKPQVPLLRHQDVKKHEDRQVQPQNSLRDIKNLPLLIKMNNSKFIRMVNFEFPPKELYVMYKCEPPELVAVFDPPESENSNEKNSKQFVIMPSATADDFNDNQNEKVNNSTTPKYKTIFPFNYAQISQATDATIEAHVHGELNSSLKLIKRNSGNRRKRKKKCHKRRKHRHQRRRIFSLNKEMSLNNSKPSLPISHDKQLIQGFRRSLLSINNSKRKAKTSKYHKKSHPLKKPKSKKSRKNSKKHGDKKIHKRETKPLKKSVKHSGNTPQLMNKVFSMIKNPRNSNPKSKTKNPRSIFDKMKQVINNVIGNGNSTIPEPRINVNPDDDEANGDDGYTEIVHQSAAKFMPKEDRHEYHENHRRKKNRHHQESHSPHHHHHHHHHQNQRIHDHHKKMHHPPPKTHPKPHHKPHLRSKPSREINQVEHLKSKMADISSKKPNPSSSSNVLEPLKIHQNDQKSFNLSSIIPTVKNLVENQNLGSLEKIIVYVDKTEGLRKKKRTAEKLSSRVNDKHHEREKKESKRSKSSDESYLDDVYFDGESLDDMISHVADKILNSVSGSSLHDLDPHLSVKVIQEVPGSAGEPHEETKSEFSIDLSDSNLKKIKKSVKNRNSIGNHISSLSSSSTRLTSGSSERKMNLRGTPGKKRNLWKDKIKRENIVEKIRVKLEEELKKKLSRKRRKVDVMSLEDSDRPLPHHLDDLDEKIRILYAMHHKKEAKGGVSNKKKRVPVKNHKRSKREDDWRLDYLESNIFANENDKKSLRGLIEQIINLQKNVNTTLQIIRKKLDDSSNKFAQNLTQRMIKDSSSSTKIEQRSISNKKVPKKNKKKINEKKKSSKNDSRKKKPTKKPDKKVVKPKNKKSPKSKTKKSKKKLEKNYGDEQVDKIGKEIQEILKEEGEGKISNKKKRINRRKVRTLKGITEDSDSIKIGRHLCSKNINRHKKTSKKSEKSKSLNKKNHSVPKKKFASKKSKSASKNGMKKSKQGSKNDNKNIREVKYQNSSRSDHSVVRNSSVNCEGCLCDLDDAVSNLRKMLLMRYDLLDRISTYSCRKFNEIGDELILTSSGVLGDVLPRSRRQIAEAKGLKYIRPGDLEDLLRGDEVRGHEHEILSFPGSDLNIPCNHEGEEITWVMSISRPNYTWTRLDTFPISGTIRKNGNLELYDVDAKDAGNYSCIVTYIDPDNEELVENIYEHSIQIVTLPRYSLRGGNRYKMENCEEQELDILSVYLPSKLNQILCKNSICDAFIFAPHCHSHQVSIRVLVVPSNPSKLFPISSSQCGLRCRKAVQDKIAYLLIQNLRIILRKTIVFRLPNRPVDKLVPIQSRILDYGRSEGGRGRRAYGRFERSRGDADGEVGLLVGCPAGYGLEYSHCVPCSPHYHSQDLSARCKRCPLGTHQPSIGSRVCKSCTNPFVDGCYDMLWTTSSVLLAILASLLAVILVGLIVLWTLCCGKRQKSQNSSISPKNEIEMSLKQPLIPPLHNHCQSDDEDLIFERPRKKKKKLVKRFLRTRDDDQPLVYGINLLPKKTEKEREKLKTIPVCCIDSYRSHGGHCPECKHPYVTNYGPRKAHRPPVPFPDFDR